MTPHPQFADLGPASAEREGLNETASGEQSDCGQRGHQIPASHRQPGDQFNDDQDSRPNRRRSVAAHDGAIMPVEAVADRREALVYRGQSRRIRNAGSQKTVTAPAAARS